MNTTKIIRLLIGRELLVAVALVLGTSAAHATVMWQNGDLTTYDQVYWGSDPTADSLLITNYDAVYAPSGVVEIGIPGPSGYSIRFSDASYILSYLPSGGPNGALDADLVNPTTTSSGAFGGTVLALRLNIDFSDAGIMPANSGVSFGDLVLNNYSTLPSLDGMTVRDISALANTLLGGGSTTYSIDNIATVTAQINHAFTGGTPDTFAQDYLVTPTSPNTPMPEPPTLALFVVGLVGLMGVGTKRRRFLS